MAVITLMLLAALVFKLCSGEKEIPDPAESAPTPNIFAEEGSEPEEAPLSPEPLEPGMEAAPVDEFSPDSADGGGTPAPVSTNPPRVSTDEEDDKKAEEEEKKDSADGEREEEPSPTPAEIPSGRDEDIIGKISF